MLAGSGTLGPDTDDLGIPRQSGDVPRRHGNLMPPPRDEEGPFIGGARLIFSIRRHRWGRQAAIGDFGESQMH